MKSTEVINSDGTISKGEDLPYSLQGHCMLTLHDGRIMIIGGSSGDKTGKTAVNFFDFTTGKFTSGPSMLTGRLIHACALFKDPNNNNKETALVAGGIEKYGNGIEFSWTSKVEILEIKDTYHPDEGWTLSKIVFCSF